MRSAMPIHTLYLPISILAFLAQSTSAKKGKGGGEGRESGSGPERNLSPSKTVIFSPFVVFTIFILFQCVAYVVFLSKPIRPSEKYPYRKRFLTLILLAAIFRTAGYALAGQVWANDRSQSFIKPLPPRVYAAADFLPRLTDTLLYTAVFLLLPQRRSMFLCDLMAAASPSTHPRHPKSTISPTYIIVPAILMMVITAFVRVGLMFRPFKVFGQSYLDPVKIFNAMGHLYLAFYIILTIVLSVMAVTLWSKVHRTLRVEERTRYDQFVLTRIVKQLIPAFITRVALELSTHIVFYLPPATTLSTVNFFTLHIVSIVVIGILYVWIFYVPPQLGVLPKQYRDGQPAQEEAAA